MRATPTYETSEGRQRNLHPPNSAARCELFGRIFKRFRGGLVSKAHRLFNNPTLGSKEIEKKKEKGKCDL